MGNTNENSEHTTFNDQADGKFDPNAEVHQYDVKNHISTQRKPTESDYEFDSDRAVDLKKKEKSADLAGKNERLS